MKDHEKRFLERVKAAKEAAIGLNNAAVRFESAAKGAWGTLEKTTSEYAIRLAQVIQENAQDLSKKEAVSKYQDVEKFQDYSVQKLNKVIINVRKYVPKLHRALKTEMATLNSSLAKLENSIRALGAALDQSPGTKIESLLLEVQQIMQKQDELLRLASQERKEATTLQTISEQERQILSEKDSLLSATEFTELKRYEESLRLKTDEIRQFLQPLTKPLLKLERAASMKQAPSVDMRILRDLIERPTETIVTCQSFAVMQLLRSLEKELRQGTLEFEAKRRRRAEETISMAKEGAIDKMREEYLTLQANVQETIRRLKSDGLMDKKDRLDELLREKNTQIEELAARKRELERRKDDLMKSVLKQKGTIESEVSKISDERISILVE
jgi:DNA repair exonuclease SbcCD ATPase subunit